jgi:uncharacterized protein YndB with AHSA1/START domain
MESKTQTQISKDLKNKKILVRREFDAPLDLVWRAWTERELLDQWWAPKPWVAKTKSLKFKDGGSWLYAMTGPDGDVNWCVTEFTAINPQKSFQASSSFCDENGNKNADFPTMLWKNVFRAMGSETLVEVELSFTKEADMEKIIAMGFESGFTMALGNLDELLASQVE